MSATAKTQAGSAPDLFTHIEAENWLAERLKAHGVDIYAGGPYTDYGERLGAAIVRENYQLVLVGRGKDGKPENYQQVWERLYERDLSELKRFAPEAKKAATG